LLWVIVGFLASIGFRGARGADLGNERENH
jgi:hypothetical protein